MSEAFVREKEQILTQYIIHHVVKDADVVELSERLDEAVERAVELHAGQHRKTGEDYVWHPIRTAMEVSRFGRIIDWASIEAALLHDTLEDTSLNFGDLRHQFPEAANLVLALTKIKDSRVHTYQKLFRYVLEDIRVLLVKLADRLDNLESLAIFKREKQLRIARESAEMYANICRRLCMTDLAERLTEKIGPILTPAEYQAYATAQAELQKSWTRPLKELRAKLAELFPGDLSARIEFEWRRFRPDTPPTGENLFRVRIVTETSEDAYRALGRVHMAFRALPGTFTDTMSTPRPNGFRALETRVAYQGRILSVYVAGRTADRFNRLGLLSMDITSPEFNLEYLDDLREFVQNDDMDIQDFLRFHRPDALQVTSPEGDVFSLEEGATALDYAFAVHEQLGLRSITARINGDDVALSTQLRPGDRVEIIAADHTVADDRYLGWAHGRKSIASLRRHSRKVEAERAATTGHRWLLDAARAQGMEAAEIEQHAQAKAVLEQVPVEEIYRRICMGDQDIAQLLAPPREAGRKKPGGGWFGILRGREDDRRRVRRYDFDDSHIRFCSRCIPTEGDDIEGVPERGRLLVHRTDCGELPGGGLHIPLRWDKNPQEDLRDPGLVELQLLIEAGSGVLYTLLAPFKALGLEVRNLRLPNDNTTLNLQFQPGSARILNRLVRALRKTGLIRELRVFRATQVEAPPHPPALADGPGEGPPVTPKTGSADPAGTPADHPPAPSSPRPPETPSTDPSAA